MYSNIHKFNGLGLDIFEAHPRAHYITQEWWDKEIAGDWEPSHFSACQAGPRGQEALSQLT